MVLSPYDVVYYFGCDDFCFEKGGYRRKAFPLSIEYHVKSSLSTLMAIKKAIINNLYITICCFLVGIAHPTFIYADLLKFV
jgi:hypothetical protein